ncbi:tail tube [Staphylococcus phage vB_SauH_DELF3]|nr:tail tube [Staphylococcus phage vB_SauH_DELF3]
MSLAALLALHTGNRALLMIKGKPVERKLSATGTLGVGTTRVYKIGSIMPLEVVYLGYEGTVRVKRSRSEKENLADSGGKSLGEEVLKKDSLAVFEVDMFEKQVIISNQRLTK